MYVVDSNLESVEGHIFDVKFVQKLPTEQLSKQPKKKQQILSKKTTLIHRRTMKTRSIAKRKVQFLIFSVLFINFQPFMPP